MSRHLEITFIAVCACAEHSFNHARQIKNAAKYNKGSCRQHKVCIHNLWPATYRKHLTSGYTAQCPSSGQEACGCSPVLGGRSKMLEESISWTSKISTASCRAVLAPPACLASVASSLLRKMEEPRKWVGEVMVGRGKGKEGEYWGTLDMYEHVWTLWTVWTFVMFSAWDRFDWTLRSSLPVKLMSAKFLLLSLRLLIHCCQKVIFTN